MILPLNPLHRSPLQQVHWHGNGPKRPGVQVLMTTVTQSQSMPMMTCMSPVRLSRPPHSEAQHLVQQAMLTSLLPK